MPESRILTDVKERLDKLNIFELRQVARAVGVHRPADGKKARVTEAILSIAQGLTAPEPPSLRGAPPKSQQYDEQLVADIKTCREYYLALAAGNAVREPQHVLSVSDSADERIEKSLKIYGGVLDLSGKYAFLRSGAVSSADDGDVFVHESFINRFSLRYGDYVECRAMRKSDDEIPGLVEVLAVNGKLCAGTTERRKFSELTHLYPEVNIKLGGKDGGAACRIIDLFAPLALGQRAFISAPPRSGKTALIKQIAAGICAGYPSFKVILAVLNGRPEEITDFKRSLGNCKLFYTSFDMPQESHILTAKLAFEYAKRQTEEGGDAVVIFDGIEKLARAYASDAVAAEEIKKLLYCACNAEEGGSLTVISTLSQTVQGSAEFLDIANMVVCLSADLAAKRLYPAVDVKKSYSDGQEKFLTTEEMRAVNTLRSWPCESVIKLFNENGDNAEIIKKYGN